MFSQLLSKWHFILRICKDILKQYFFFLYHLSSAWLAAVVPPPLLCLLSKQKSLLLQHEGELCWLKKELVNNQLNSDFSKTTSTQTIYNSIKYIETISIQILILKGCNNILRQMLCLSHGKLSCWRSEIFAVLGRFSHWY